MNKLDRKRQKGRTFTRNEYQVYIIKNTNQVKTGSSQALTE